MNYYYVKEVSSIEKGCQFKNCMYITLCEWYKCAMGKAMCYFSAYAEKLNRTAMAYVGATQNSAIWWYW